MSRVTQIRGLPVIDAKRSLAVQVKQSDITRSRVQAPDRCAMARACYRELHCLEVRVHLSRTYIRTNDHCWVRYFTPGALRDEIIAFDRGGRFEPGAFILSAPPPHAVLGKRQRSGGKATGRGMKRSHHVLTNVRATASSE